MTSQRIPTDADLRDMRVLVMGLGRFGGGVGVTRFLVKRGARVRVTDMARAETLAPSLERLQDLQVSFRLGEHCESDLDDADLLVVSPAVDRRKSAFFAAAQRRGVPWTTEMNLFVSRCPAEVAAVTGSVGKSTTCAMLAAILDSAIQRGRVSYGAVHFGGNIGRSLLEDLDAIAADDAVVLELSSFQLDCMAGVAFRPKVACITNIIPHHLDRHEGLDGYVRAKLEVTRGQQAGDTLVICQTDAPWQSEVRSMAAERGVKLVAIEPVAAKPALRLRVPGAHNQVNAWLAASMAHELGVAADVARVALEGFAGLPHRLQFVAERSGVRYYNDSKSTSAAAVATAVAAFDGPIVVLCGGKDSGEEVHAIAQTQMPRARAIVCFGEAGNRLADLIEQRPGGAPGPAVYRAANLAEAVQCAQTVCRAGDAVLLSPGCPSYDEFANYEHRGESFVRLVESLAR